MISEAREGGVKTDGKPTRDFWCVVLLDDSGQDWVIRRSHDVIIYDVLMEFAGEDNGLNNAWAKDKPAGLYRLELSPWGSGPDMNGEYDTGVDVNKVEPLFVLPPPPRQELQRAEAGEREQGA